MKRYEYQYLGIELRDDRVTNLYEFDHWGQDGWRVIAVIKGKWDFIALLEKESVVNGEEPDEL